MSSYSDYANAASDILLKKGEAAARAKEQTGQIWGSTIANLGQTIPKQVQDAMALGAQRRKQAQIQSILQQAGPDLRSALPQIRAIDPKLSLDFEKELNSADEVAGKAAELKAKHEKEARDFQLNVIATAKNPSQYASGLKGLHDAGFDTSPFDTEFSEDAVSRANQLLMSPDARGKTGGLVPLPGPNGPIYGTPQAGAPVYEKQPPKADYTLGNQRMSGETNQPIATASGAATGLKPGTIENYFATYASERNKTPDQLTTAEQEDARKRFNQADDRPRVNVNVSGAGADKLSDEAVADTATRYRILGTSAIPTRIDAQERVRILNEAAKQTRALGQTAAQSTQKQAAFKSDAASLTQMQKMASSAEAYESKALAQADLIGNLSQQVPRSASPLLNDWWLSGKQKVIGDKNTQLLFNALDTFTTEYAKIMAGSTGSAGATSDAATHKAEGLISASLGKGTLQATLDQMKWEMAQTMKGYDATIAHITERMGGAPTTTTTTTPTVTPTKRYNPATGKAEPIP